MIATLRLLPVLLRRAPRQAAGAAALCAAGVAVATLVALVRGTDRRVALAATALAIVAAAVVGLPAGLII